VHLSQPSFEIRLTHLTCPSLAWDSLDEALHLLRPSLHIRICCYQGKSHADSALDMSKGKGKGIQEMQIVTPNTRDAMET